MIISWLAWLLERPLVVREPLRPLDAIVVLGAAVYPDGTMSPAFEERVDAAAQLYRDGGGRVVAATGGVTGGSRAEADVAADALRDRGVPDVIVERASQDTDDNARLTAELLAPLGLRSVWLVTQPFHGRRAARLFRTEGLDAHVWHIDHSIEYIARWRALRWLIREYAAWAKLLVRELAAWLGLVRRPR